MNGLCWHCGSTIHDTATCAKRIARERKVEMLAHEVKRWTDEASIQGGLKRTAEKAQLNALDLATRAQTELIDLLNDTRSKSKTEDQETA